MVFQVPPAKQSIDQNKFDLQLEKDGTVYSLPSMKLLRPADVAKIESGSLTAFGDLLEKHAPGLFEAIPTSEALEAIMNAWTKDSGLDLGESKASAIS